MDKRSATLALALGQVVRDRRTTAGHSQETFAEMCGLHRTYVGSIERGERNITLANILRIATALGTTPSGILLSAERLAGVEPHSAHQALLERLEKLTDIQLALLSKMAEAMSQVIAMTINADSDILTHELGIAIANQLTLHHATNEEKLNKKAFEFLLTSAFTVAGREATIVQNPTNPGADIVVDGIRFSLKTQADSAAKAHSIYIQKFMEARWVRDFEGQQLVTEAKKRTSEHLTHYQRILVLQALSESKNLVKYRLIEVPKALLMLMTELPDGSFNKKNDYGSCGTDIADSQGVAFRMFLDGSVEKVRIFNLRISRCIIHGEWIVPTHPKST